MKAIEPTITGIFPTPIYITQLGRKFSDKENKFIDKNKKNINVNEGNVASKNSYILNSKELINIKKKLNKVIKDYFDKVINTTNSIEPYITQSWINYTEKNQYHHKHSHANSLVSGILYLNADIKTDKIFFFKPGYDLFKPEIKNFNVWNSSTWFFPVDTGKIILFPSSLVHEVQYKQGIDTRVSLSFNVFFKGSIGVEVELTKLIL